MKRVWIINWHEKTDANESSKSSSVKCPDALGAAAVLARFEDKYPDYVVTAARRMGVETEDVEL